MITPEMTAVLREARKIVNAKPFYDKETKPLADALAAFDSTSQFDAASASAEAPSAREAVFAEVETAVSEVIEWMHNSYGPHHKEGAERAFDAIRALQGKK